MQRSYHRHLPHEIPEGYPLFVSWNLKGALPRHCQMQLRAERHRLLREPQRPGETAAARRTREGKRLFLIADRYLDTSTTGPLHLKDPAAARLVEEAILFGAGERYDLYAWCVMANHVHVLLKPRRELKRITQGIKGFTARRINELHNARGRVFWQDESYDHWPRDDESFLRIIQYIEDNPVAAGLCQTPTAWPWSSSRFRENWPVGQPFQADQCALPTDE